MNNEWLNPNEKCLLSFNSRMILEQMVKANLPLIFDNTESPIAGTIPPYGGEPYEWIVRIRAPMRLGGRTELFVGKNEDEYNLACDQITRYIRYLMKLYLEFKSPSGGTV